jgi:hypothetical protein
VADTKYTYSSSGIEPERLGCEIVDSEISSALYLGIKIEDGNCDVWFDDPLSSPDQTTLASLVSAHNGESYHAAYDSDYICYAKNDTKITSAIEQPNWLEKLKLTTPLNTPNAYHKISYQYEWNIDVSAKTFMARVRFDGSNIHEQFERVMPARDDNMLLCSGFDIVEISGAKDITIDVSRESGGNGSISIARARLFVRRVS